VQNLEPKQIITTNNGVR